MSKQTSIVSKEDTAKVLRTKGFRVTNARVALLQLLVKFGKPVSVTDLLKKWRQAPNQATVYRMLSDLSAAGIIKRVGTLQATSYFEYTPHKPHHHHLVCTGCGYVEDVDRCFANQLESSVAEESKKFATVESHSLEFFGTCRACTHSNHH